MENLRGAIGTIVSKVAVTTLAKNAVSRQVLECARSPSGIVFFFASLDFKYLKKSFFFHLPQMLEFNKVKYTSWSISHLDGRKNGFKVRISS